MRHCTIAQTIFCFSVILLIPIILQSQTIGKWVQKYPNYSHVIVDIEFVSVSVGWMITMDGGMYKSVDGGTNWFEQKKWNQNNLVRLYAQSEQHVCVFSSDGYCLWTVDGGRSWSDTQTGLKSFRSAFFLDRNYGYVNGDVLARTENGGASWTIVYTQGFREIAFHDRHRGVSVDNISVTNDSGYTWRKKLSSKSDPFDWEFFTSIAILDSVWVIYSEFGSHGGWNGNYRYVSVDEGETWTRTRDFTVFKLNTLRSLHTRTMISLSDRWVNISSNAGENWVQASALPDDFYDGQKIIAIDELHWWCLGQDGHVIRTTNGGTIWETISNTPLQAILNVNIKNAQLGIAAGLYGFVLKTIDGGNTWQQMSFPTRDNILTTFIFDDENFICVTNYRYEAYRTTNGGITWVRANVPFDSTSTPFKMFFLTDSIGWALHTETRRVSATTNGGQTWTLVYPNSASKLSAVYFINKVKGFIVGDSSLLMMTTDGGTSWERRTIPNSSSRTVTNLQFASDDLGVASQFSYRDSQYYHLTTDGGFTWQSQPSPPNGTIEISLVDYNRRWAICTIQQGQRAERIALYSSDAGVTWIDTHSGKINALFPLPSGEAWSTGDSAKIFFFEFIPVTIRPINPLPMIPTLEQNYPNPFGLGSFEHITSTAISFTTPTGYISLTITDLLGREVISLFENFIESGRYTIFFNPLERGIDKPSGIYSIRLVYNTTLVTKKLVWIK